MIERNRAGRSARLSPPTALGTHKSRGPGNLPGPEEEIPPASSGSLAKPELSLDLDALFPRLRPGNRGGTDLAAPLCIYQVVEALQDDPPLQFAVERHPEVVPHHERQEHCSWRLRVLGHIKRNRGGDGWNPSLL